MGAVDRELELGYACVNLELLKFEIQRACAVVCDKLKRAEKGRVWEVGSVRGTFDD